MLRSASGSRIRLSAVALAVSGVLFFFYPALRPFSDEESLQGAAAFASAAWLLAHMLAMVGFTLLSLGVLGLQSSLQGTVGERLAFGGLVVSLIGTGLTLPFYGGEAFGLHAIGQEAARQQSAALVSLANVVRSGPGLVMFLVGLLLVAISATMVAIAVWKSGKYPRWSGIPFAVGFGLYVPQFAGTQSIRVAHGLRVAIGCLWLAASLWRRGRD